MESENRLFLFDKYLFSIDKDAGRMKLKPGYKHTEAGFIPNDWEVRTLGSLTRLLTNGFVGTATSAYVENDEGVLYVQGYNVLENGFNFHGIKRVSRSFHDRNQKSCLQLGDLLTIQTGEIGVTAVVSGELVGANCHALIISRLNEHKSEPHFYCHYFNSEQGRAAFKAIETGTTMKHLNCGDMKQLVLPSPPVEEQRAIATALNDMDALLGSLDQLIVKKRDIKQAAMQQLLTGQTRLPGFSAAWQVKRLGDLCERITKGTTPTTLGHSYTNSGVYFFKVESLGADGNILPNALAFISEGTAQILKRSLLQAGDLLFSIAGAIGRTAVVSSQYLPANTNQALAIIRLKKDLDVDRGFLRRVLAGPALTRHLRQISVQAAQANISLSDIGNFQFQLPEPREQIAISEALLDMEAEIEILETRRTKTRNLKQAMMQELLTGRIRLING